MYCMSRLASLAGGIVLATASASHGNPPNAVVAAADWELHDGGSDGAAYSALRGIGQDNVAALGLAWSLDLPGERTLEGTPLAIDGILYVTGSLSKVYAVDGATGRLLWSFDPEVSQHMPDHMQYIMGVNRGAAYADGRLFVGTIDGRLIALNAKSGALLWSAETVTAESRHTITGAPAIVNGKVLIGNGGADYGERGYVSAYDAVTGKQIWRFHTTPGSPAENAGNQALQMAARTWTGEYWKTGTGGTVWHGMNYDPEYNRVYIGTGNATPYDPAVRSPGGGDNLFLASIVALDADSGRYVWHYQVNPREAWDFKATANIVTATIDVAGQPRKVLMQAPTNGFFYVIDRDDGKLLSAGKTTKVTWADRIDLVTGRPVEVPNIRYETGSSAFWPSPFGSHNWQTMAYSPATGLAYIPIMHLGARYDKSADSGSGTKAGGIRVTLGLEDEDEGTGSLVAWDVRAQTPRWRVKYDSPWNGGTMATAGGLVFQGTGDGLFIAYDAGDGHKLWQFDAGLGIVGAPIMFETRGKQYVSILVGYGGAPATISQMNRGWKFGRQPRRLLTFALNGNAILPPTLPRDFTLVPVDDAALTIDPKLAADGAGLYAAHCALCHGMDLKSDGSNGPDLRESAATLDRDAVFSVVKDGVLAANGMPRFRRFDGADIDRLYMYIRAGARNAITADDSPKPAAARSER